VAEAEVVVEEVVVDMFVVWEGSREVGNEVERAD
jgi:hypothetical protein